MPKVSNKSVSWEIWILCAILLFAFLLRIYDLGKPVLWIDETISANTAKAIVNTGIPVFGSGFIDSRAFVFHYIQAFFLLFGINDFNVRLVSVLFGLATIVLAYFIGKKYSASGGIIAAAFMALFYLEVFFSRQARMYQMFQFMFFISLYLLYKSKDKPAYLYLAIISFFITLDTHLQGLILAPFFILHILIFNRNKWYLTILPAIPLVQKFFGVTSMVSDSAQNLISYSTEYLSYTQNIAYMLILFIPGVIWSFKKNKHLTLLLVLPSLVALIGIFNLQTFAFRYSYFFVFSLVLYFSLFLSYLYENYGKIILIAILVLLVIPSNLFFPYSYVNVVKPITNNFNDFSAPEINLKALPIELKETLSDNSSSLFVIFSPATEWYLKSPTYVLPFSLDGRGSDQISRNSSSGEVVDFYSGAKIMTTRPAENFYFIEDGFSRSKLKDFQIVQLNNITSGCITSYKETDLTIYSCGVR